MIEKLTYEEWKIIYDNIPDDLDPMKRYYKSEGIIVTDEMLKEHYEFYLTGGMGK